MDDLLRIIRDRHSTRAPFNPRKPVPKGDVRTIIEAGRWAPTAHNMQNFEVIVIDDDKVLERLGNVTTYPSPEFIRENFEQLSMSEGELRRKKVGILGLGFPPAWRDRTKLEAAIQDRTSGILSETIKGSPTILIVVHDTRKRAPASEGDVLGILSLGCVMENMWLMAQELGIGFQIMSIFSGPAQEEIKRILKIPRHMAVTFAIRLGYLAVESDYLRVRRDIESFTFLNEYGKRW